MNINGKEISKEIIAKATACKSTDELLELAKRAGRGDAETGGEGRFLELVWLFNC